MLRKALSDLKASVYFDRFPNYCQMVNEAKSLARRSILIDHCGVDDIDLKNGFNNIEHVYSIEKTTGLNTGRLSLIEFENEEEADRISRQAKHKDNHLPIPLKVFTYNAERHEHDPSDQQNLPFPVDRVKLSHTQELGSSITSHSDLVNSNSMSLLGLKMRFITLINFEKVLCSGPFVDYELMPFGSSVNGIGSDAGDLDLILTRKMDHQEFMLNSFSQSHKEVFRQTGVQNLVHLDKKLRGSSDRQCLSNTLRYFDFLLREYTPLTDEYGLNAIGHARVPIIKFKSRVTSIECDLSFNIGHDHTDRGIMEPGYSGILMSQIMYSLCQNNNLFSSLVIYLKIIGGLTSIIDKNQRGFTTFQFISLIIFYLQQVELTSPNYNIRPTSENHHSIVPKIEDLLEPSSRDTAIIKLTDTELDQVLPKLIKGFFKFYSDFNFARTSMNLYNGMQTKKLDNSAVHIVNPLDVSQNICRSVNGMALANVKREIENASRWLDRSDKRDPLELIGLILKRNEYMARNRGKVRLLQNSPGSTDSCKDHNLAEFLQDCCN